jgi:uncharacterized membrane protein
MTAFSIDPAVGWSAALALAMVFGASAVMKFADLDEFSAAVENYRIAPRRTARFLALVIPAAESAGAAGMLLVRVRPAAALLLVALLVAFTAAIAFNLARGRRNIDCGCLGPGLRQELSWWLVARNGGLIAFALIAALPWGARALGALDRVTISFASATAVALYAAANLLLVNAPRLRALEMGDA